MNPILTEKEDGAVPQANQSEYRGTVDNSRLPFFDMPAYHIVSLSGGKDSTAMLLRLLEENRPVDEIIFCDTGLEFPQMYEHIDKLEAYIGRPITRLKAQQSFESYLLDYTPPRHNPALSGLAGMGWPNHKSRWCTAMLKTRIIESYLKEKRKRYRLVEYVGIAADEQQRVADKVYPLVEWGMTEADCLAYCYERGFDWGGLYKLFRRVSCWCCPLQPISELRKLWVHYPELWHQLEEWDAKTWSRFRLDYSVQNLAARFLLEQEWTAAGKRTGTRAFYRELRERIEEVSNNGHQDERIAADNQGI